MTSGICDVQALVETLQRHDWTNLPVALQEYSARQVPEGVAIIELIYVHQMFSHPLFVLQTAVRKALGLRTFAASIGDPSIKYSDIYKK